MITNTLNGMFRPSGKATVANAYPKLNKVNSITYLTLPPIGHTDLA
jgi:hypothetical protein